MVGSGQVSACYSPSPSVRCPIYYIYIGISYHITVRTVPYSPTVEGTSHRIWQYCQLSVLLVHVEHVYVRTKQ